MTELVEEASINYAGLEMDVWGENFDQLGNYECCYNEHCGPASYQKSYYVNCDLPTVKNKKLHTFLFELKNSGAFVKGPPFVFKFDGTHGTQPEIPEEGQVKDQSWMLFISLGIGAILGVFTFLCFLINRITSNEENSVKLTVLKNLKRSEETETLQPL
jgi:hypothetical protein